MTDAPPRAAGSYLRFLAWAAAITAAVAALGAVPTRRLGGEGALPALLAGCAIGLIASAVGGVPVALAAGAGRRADLAPAVLAAMGLRFAVALALGLAAALSGWFERGPLLVWLALSYLALLGADTKYALAALRRPGEVEPETR
jgi:hypothetical protein